MNTKALLCLSCFLAVTFTISTVNAGPRRDGRNRFVSRPARTFVGGNRIASWNTGQHWNHQHFVSGKYWNGGNWNNNWYWHHHRRFRDFVFLDFGFPFFGWGGYPYYYDYYPYGCYPYGSSYGYYSGGYYGNSYYGGSNYNYGNGYGYDNNSYGYTSGQSVTELQRKLADAGYYHGPIDGIMGSRTYYALKAYRHDNGNGTGKNSNGGYSPTLRDKPYSPPPITTEPSPNE